MSPSAGGVVIKHSFALLVLVAAAPAGASPPYPLEDLLRRAETVFVARRLPADELAARESKVASRRREVVLEQRALVRGRLPDAPLRFTLEPDSQLPAGDYVVISQGDDHFGPPTHAIRLGQRIEGQAGYRGWIAFPVEHDARGELLSQMLLGKHFPRAERLDLDALPRFVARHPYHRGP
jgi:hypothetical protein